MLASAGTSPNGCCVGARRPWRRTAPKRSRWELERARLGRATWVRLNVSGNDGPANEKRQRTAALQDAVALFEGDHDSARFWSAAVLCRFCLGSRAVPDSFYRTQLEREKRNRLRTRR